MALTGADLNEVFEFLSSIRGKWLLLGTSLKINSGKLEDIRAQHGTDSKSGLLEMLKLWLKANRTWAELAKALYSAMVEEEELAEKGKR
jgi:tRNA splicing ligase